MYVRRAVGGGWLGGRERGEKHILLLLGTFSRTEHDHHYRHGDNRIQCLKPGWYWVFIEQSLIL